MGLSGIDVMKQMGCRAMTGYLQDVTGFITGLPKFTVLKHICDLGGNHGYYTMTLLDTNPQLRGTICDLPQVAETSRKLIAEMGCSKRMNVVGMDLNSDSSLGKKYDLVLASNIRYLWKGRRETIFERIGTALVPGGILISKHMTKPDNPGIDNTVMEFPTHFLAEQELKDAFQTCGFGHFDISKPDDNRLILAVRRL